MAVIVDMRAMPVIAAAMLDVDQAGAQLGLRRARRKGHCRASKGRTAHHHGACKHR
ncbi:hypothetical protein [Chelativorans composti]|uniref:Uncharacterized protein n=1 Tax=Chelativorans composti TaxID=768533 RepID=A0ABW5DCX3_9HYPH